MSPFFLPISYEIWPWLPASWDVTPIYSWEDTSGYEFGRVSALSEHVPSGAREILPGAPERNASEPIAPSGGWKRNQISPRLLQLRLFFVNLVTSPLPTWFTRFNYIEILTFSGHLQKTANLVDTRSHNMCQIFRYLLSPMDQNVV